jgi:hypothetical protein
MGAQAVQSPGATSAIRAYSSSGPARAAGRSAVGPTTGYAAATPAASPGRLPSLPAPHLHADGPTGAEPRRQVIGRSG